MIMKICLKMFNYKVCGLFWTHDDSEVADRKWCFYDFKALDGGTALTYTVGVGRIKARLGFEAGLIPKKHINFGLELDSLLKI